MMAINTVLLSNDITDRGMNLETVHDTSKAFADFTGSSKDELEILVQGFEMYGVWLFVE